MATAIMSESIFITIIKNKQNVIENQILKQPIFDSSKYYQALMQGIEIEVPQFQDINQEISIPPYLETFTFLQRAIKIDNSFRLIATDGFINIRNRANLLLQTIQPPDRYYTFQIPKASGGYRTITAPCEELKRHQREVLDFFQKILKMQVHNCAFAYVPGRSTADAIRCHQQNQSNWFLKLDIKDFFPSCSTKFITEQLRKIYPTSLIHHQQITGALQGCLLDDALPQGAPTSPYLSNLIMVPIDYEINKRLYNFGKHHYVYTRYADDILISSRENFNQQEIITVIKEILKDTPLKIKDEKTRYGSRSGRNWNLGIMLNKDNNMTLGYRFKERFRAALFNLYKDTEKGVQWEPHDIMMLAGQASYYKNICPTEAGAIIQKFERQFGKSFKDITKLN